jgi:hypothetical protein
MLYHLPKLFKAMAVISESARGKAPTAIFFKLNKKPIPIETFENKSEAKEWPKQFL